jgi:hypothetical protein
MVFDIQYIPHSSKQRSGSQVGISSLFMCQKRGATARLVAKIGLYGAVTEETVKMKQI